MPKLCRVALALAIMLCGALLAAQASPYQEAIERSRIALAYEPTNAKLRLELAYYQMLAGTPEQALESYRMVHSQDPASSDAKAGILWALNTLSRPKDSIREAKDFLRGDDDPLLRYHLANARLATGKYLAARKDYSLALLEISDPFLKASARQNLAWAYRNVADHSWAEVEYKKADPRPAPDPLLKTALRKPAFTLDAKAGLNSDDGSFHALTATIRFHSMSLRLGWDQFRVDGDRYRDAYQVGLAKQFLPGDASASIQFLNGTDQRVYPATAGSVVLSPKVYVGPAALQARLGAHISSYQRLNAYQSDLGMGIRTDIFSASYQASYVYQDKEALGMDSHSWVHTWDLSAVPHRNWGIGIHGGTGDFAWAISSQGAVTDDFDPVDSYLGLSLSMPLTKHLRAVFYTQTGSIDEENSLLAYARLLAWF